jgi:hypothetical protein
MVNQNLARGVFLTVVALLFGGTALRYPIGDFSRAGPGLFPLMTSGLLLVLGLLAILQSRLVPAVPLYFNAKNIALIMAALASFVIFSHTVSMLLGIAAMVFVAGFAANTYSWKRNVQITLGLIVVAIAFQKLLGLNLRLF